MNSSVTRSTYHRIGVQILEHTSAKLFVLLPKDMVLISSSLYENRKLTEITRTKEKLLVVHSII